MILSNGIGILDLNTAFQRKLNSSDGSKSKYPPKFKISRATLNFRDLCLTVEETARLAYSGTSSYFKSAGGFSAILHVQLFSFAGSCGAVSGSSWDGRIRLCWPLALRRWWRWCLPPFLYDSFDQKKNGTWFQGSFRWHARFHPGAGRSLRFLKLGDPNSDLATVSKGVGNIPSHTEDVATRQKKRMGKSK